MSGLYDEMMDDDSNQVKPMDHWSPISSIPPKNTMPSASLNPADMMVKNTSRTSTPRNMKQTKSRHDSGLQRFSKDVLEKVKEKGVTSFDEVADEMFRSMTTHPTDDLSENVKKNIRRRVYDVLNVLVALEIVSKDRKEITWVGLPMETPEEQLQLEQEKKEVEESIQQKTTELQQLLIQQVNYKHLLQSKMTSDHQPASGSTVHLPFIAVQTSKNTNITHATSKDKLEHVFNFDQPFQIHDSMEVLMRMGIAFGSERNMCSEKNLGV